MYSTQSEDNYIDEKRDVNRQMELAEICRKT